MTYLRLTGGGAAFGWAQGTRVTLGGLQAGAAYRLICQEGDHALTANAQGAYSGSVSCGAPLCLAQGEEPILYDETRLTRQAAALLIAARTPPPPVLTPQMPYRKPSSAPPVDALPPHKL